MGSRAAMRIGALLGVAGTLAIAAPTRADGLGALVVYSDPSDFVGANRVFHFRPGRTSFGASRQGSERLLVWGRTKAGEELVLQFAAPEGKTIRRGVYDHAQRWPFEDFGRPGIDAGGFSRGCNEASGRFEVKDLATRRGRVERLWLVFEHHCESSSDAMWGEARLGRRDHGGPALVDPAVVRWPVAAEGGTRKDVPVTVRARRKVKIRSATVAGGLRSDFPVRSDSCSGRALRAGGSCHVVVGFAPSAPGTRTAVLRIADSSHREHSVRLQGFTHGGRTRLVLDSSPDDGIDDGRDSEYTPADAFVGVAGDTRGLVFNVNRGEGERFEFWNGGFFPGEGRSLAPGRYGPVTEDPGQPRDSGAPRMDVGGSHGRCHQGFTGSFDVREATFDSWRELKTLALEFEQRCEGRSGVFTGLLEWRVGDDVKLAPWMRP